ncbi:MAG: hypothetical protein LC667_20870 [Thioalkalivibrio sp.]|nr:hypothetical protein [Thioalkalivibrio sp.]
MLEIFSAADASWPGNHKVLLERAKFHRYVWNYMEAISCFDRLVRVTGDIDLRQEAILGLAETVLTAVIHGDNTADTMFISPQLIQNTGALMRSLAQVRSTARSTALLSERLEFEVHGIANWESIDEAYSLVIGAVDEYLQTVVTNLDELREWKDQLPRNAGEATRTGFTSPAVLRGMGQLYLRRAEKGVSVDQLDDAIRAFSCFDACRLLEQSLRGSETVTSAFERGRTILFAMRVAGKRTPFKIPQSRDNDGWRFAYARFQSALDRSVGQFHAIVKRRIAELAELKGQMQVASARSGSS